MRRSFCQAAKRRREIVRHALHVGAAETEDFDRWLISWAQHNPRSKDPVGALMFAAERMGRPISEAHAETILDEAKTGRRYHKADSVGRWLGVTYAVRERLGFTTIGCIDVSKRGRRLLRKQRDRLYQQRKRREKGARPQSESLSATQPWEELGMSRRTWYRRNKAGKSVGTDSSAALFLSPADRVVPAERKRASEGGTSCLPIVGVDRYASLPLELRMMALGLPMDVELARAA